MLVEKDRLSKAAIRLSLTTFSIKRTNFRLVVVNPTRPTVALEKRYLCRLKYIIENPFCRTIAQTSSWA